MLKLCGGGGKGYKMAPPKMGGGGGSWWMSMDPVPWWEGQWHQPTAFHAIPFPATAPTTGVLTGVVPWRKSCHYVDRSLSQLMAWTLS